MVDNVDMLLNPQSQIFSVLGNISNNPSMLLENNNLKEEDFLLDFHKVLYKTIYNILYDNPTIENINEVTIDNYLKPYPKFYNVWRDNDGVNYIHDAKSVAQKELYEHDYNVIKKYSLLRKYRDNGIDIRDLYNYDETDINKQTKDIEHINSMSVSDIIEHYTNKVIQLRDDTNEDEGNIVKFNINDDIDTLVSRLGEKPEMGYPFVNGYYNDLFKGMRGGKYLLRSAETGGGKTRQDMRDMCNVSCDEIYEIGQGWVKTNASAPTLFISTELNKQELQVLALAYLTGLTTSEIENGNFTKEQLKRLNYGVEVLKKSNMFFVYIDDFSINDIQLLIEEYVMKYDVKYVVFDYIQNSPKLSKTLQDSYGHVLREDEILTMVSKRLKFLAERYDIFIISSTQLNGKAKDDNIFISKDSNVLRGGRATADKIDYGVLTFRATKSDRKQLSDIIDKQQGFENKEPNFAHYVYKNRAGLDHIVLWTYFDLGNMREELLFVTDYNYDLSRDVRVVDGVVVDDDSNKSKNSNNTSTDNETLETIDDIEF